MGLIIFALKFRKAKVARVSYSDYNNKYKSKKQGFLSKKISQFFSKLMEKGHEHVTVMFIPHSEKKIFNFQISNFALIFIFIVTLSTTIGGLYYYMHTDIITQQLEESTDDYLTMVNTMGKINHSLKPLKQSTNKLVESTTELKTMTLGRSIAEPNRMAEHKGGVLDQNAKLMSNNKNQKDKDSEANQLMQLHQKIGIVQNELNGTVELLKGYKQIFKNMPSIFPVLGSNMGKGYVVSNFGWRRDPFTYKMTLHQGVDIINLPGTPIVAAADGYVLASQRGGGRGLYVELKHQFGYTTMYLHMSALHVEAGDRVKKGQSLGLLGSTGRSTGPHLHYEVRINNTPVDPSPFIRLDKFRKLVR